MITNKDIRVENGFLIINGDKFPLDGQSPETIMEIVEDNSDTTPTENSTAPVTSGGVYTALGTKQDTLTFDTVPTENSTNPVESGGVYTALSNKAIIVKATTSDTKNFSIPKSIWSSYGFGSGSNHTALFCGGYANRISAGLLGLSGEGVSVIKLGDNTVSVSISGDNIIITFSDTVYTDLSLILCN